MFYSNSSTTKTAQKLILRADECIFSHHSPSRGMEGESRENSHRNICFYCLSQIIVLPSCVRAKQDTKMIPPKKQHLSVCPRWRLRCNSPLGCERRLFPSNGSISGLQKVIWKTRACTRTHTFTRNIKDGSESPELFNWKSSSVSGLKGHIAMSRKYKCILK